MALRNFLARRRAAALLRAPAEAGPGTQLADVRRRLEIVIAALYDRPVTIAPAPAPKRRLGRVLGGWGARAEPAAANDGERIILPAELEGDDALARYRLMAIAQAERVARGTALLAPGDRDPLERDLYLLFESAAVDAAIVERVPGLRSALAEARAAESARRSAKLPRAAAAREVESIVRQLLAADVSAPPAALAGCDSPEESLRRARAAATRIRAVGRYRGMDPVALWGSIIPPTRDAGESDGRPAREASDAEPRAGGPDGAAGRDPSANQDTVQMPDQSATANPDGEASPDDAPPDNAPPDDADEPGGEAGSGASEVSDGDAGERPEVAAERASPTVFPYPEWDYRARRHRSPGAVVRLHPSAETDGAWARAALGANAALARRIRQQFERLRARRIQLPRQPRGDELDLAACVRMLTELRAGFGGEDRLYTSVIPARRDVAITLLVDISGSTSEVVGQHRIIDVEKLALLLTGEALDALGDPYSILCFSGATASNVRIRHIKGFDERNGDTVRRRVDALQPEGFTRLGAAIRHATALLRAHPAGRRLLLILSDGRPNDDDEAYEGRYGVEDSRQAVAETRDSGIHPFCLTVDTRGGDYLPRIFGPTGHVILNRVELLPGALVGVIREIFRR